MKKNYSLKPIPYNLTIKDLRVSVDNKEIVKGVNLTVKPGEIHAIMGPNGSGKSSLAMALMGHPTYKLKVNNEKSKIILDGKDISDLPPHERAKKGLFLAFQYPVTVAGVSVQNFLRQAHQAVNGKSPQSILEFRQSLTHTAKELGIKPELLSRSLNDGFSGGEKKRLEILQLLTLRPKFAILDETDSGLDIDAVKVVAKGIKTVAQKFNTGIVIITHYQRILRFIKPDHVHIMVNGQIIKSGDFQLAHQIEQTGYKNFLKAKSYEL